jgi:hypothetical protein
MADITKFKLVFIFFLIRPLLVEALEKLLLTDVPIDETAVPNCKFYKFRELASIISEGRLLLSLEFEAAFLLLFIF